MRASDKFLAWAAGFFDGEGNVSMHYAAYTRRRKRYRAIRAQVSQTRREPLQALKREFGGTVHEVYPRGSRQRTWAWGISGPDKVRHMYTKLKPYLRIKGSQFREQLRKYDQSPASIPL